MKGLRGVCGRWVLWHVHELCGVSFWRWRLYCVWRNVLSFLFRPGEDFYSTWYSMLLMFCWGEVFRSRPCLRRNASATVAEGMQCSRGRCRCMVANHRRRQDALSPLGLLVTPGGVFKFFLYMVFHAVYFLLWRSIPKSSLVASLSGGADLLVCGKTTCRLFLRPW
jgi:hypothetical protein